MGRNLGNAMTRVDVLKLLALIFLLQLALGVQAQADNVLTNPDFEEDFTEREDNALLQVASGWNPWHSVPAEEGAPSWALVQPEYVSASESDEVAHIREGETSQILRTFYATFDAGLLQEVTDVDVDSWLRFSVFAWVWSSTMDDQTQSEGDGDVFVQVGIDPDGGSDAESDDIVWSEVTYELYDGWREFVVLTQATANEVSIFIRARIGQPVRNTVIWLDKAGLILDAFDEVVVSALSEIVAPTPSPTRVPVFHLVQQGESLADVALQYGTTVEAILTANNLSTASQVYPGNQLLIPDASAPTVLTGQSAISDSVARYVVRAGDTFSGIATIYGIAVEELEQLNDGVNVSLLEAGQSLIVPAVPAPPLTSRTYTVRRGDTLYDISLRFNVPVEELARVNNLALSSLLDVGQTLIIP